MLFVSASQYTCTLRMDSREFDGVRRIAQEAAQRSPGLEMLLVFGSRARGEAGSNSDWDFGYLARPGFDAESLVAELSRALETDNVDLVALASAGGLLRYRAARDGVLLYESVPGRFDRYWMEAVSFWCDAEPVLHPAYEGFLEGIKP